MDFLDQFSKDLIPKLISILATIITVIIIFVIARIVMNIVSHFTSKAMKKADNLTDKLKAQEVKTTMTVVHSANRYIVYLVAILMTLGTMGMSDSVSSAVVAAGVGGLIISFGAQSIIKDMLAGAFLLFERQFFVGDYVKIGNYQGTVESIALRVTYLNVKGQRVIIPNGSINEIINYSRSNIITFISIPTPYEANTKEVMNVIQKVVDKYYSKNTELFASKPEVLGISDFGDSAININLRIETVPMKHWEVERAIKLVIKEEFDKKGISIPYQQVVVHKG